MIDLHVHSSASSDARGSVLDYRQQARKIGVKVLCLTNHLEYIHKSTGLLDIDFKRDLDRYEGEFKTTKSLREGPEILLGAELGNRLKYRHQMEEYIRYFDWDFLVGSAHAIDGFGIASNRGLGYFEGKSEQEAYGCYFNRVEELLNWGPFQSFAHFDIIKRNGVTFYGPFRVEKYRDRIYRLLRLIEEKDMALELNTSGYFENPQEPYPCQQILEMAYETGIRKVTIGSDCHDPKNLGRGIKQGLALLREVGFKEITFFRKRVPFKMEILDTASK